MVLSEVKMMIEESTGSQLMLEHKTRDRRGESAPFSRSRVPWLPRILQEPGVQVQMSPWVASSEMPLMFHPGTDEGRPRKCLSINLLSFCGRDCNENEE